MKTNLFKGAGVSVMVPFFLSLAFLLRGFNVAEAGFVNTDFFTIQGSLDTAGDQFGFGLAITRDGSMFAVGSAVLFFFFLLLSFFSSAS